jgi:hypothetical protein
MTPIMSLIRQLTQRDDLSEIAVTKPGFRLELRRAAMAEA